MTTVNMAKMQINTLYSEFTIKKFNLCNLYTVPEIISCIKKTSFCLFGIVSNRAML